MTSRSRLLSLAALTLSVVLSGPTLALAQEVPESPQEIHDQLTPTMLNSESGKLHSVTSSMFPLQTVSSKFAADDVIVPPGNEWWLVSAVSIVGQLCLDQSLGDTISLLVYYNSGAIDSGSPGFLRQSVALSVVSGWSGGCATDATQVDFQLQSPIVLPSGNKYWLSVQSSSQSLSRFLSWATRGALTHQPAMYQSGGSLPECANAWSLRTECVGGIPGDDMAWSLTYSTFNGNVVYIPQLGRP